jgi:hypothetical protein
MLDIRVLALVEQRCENVLLGHVAEPRGAGVECDLDGGHPRDTDVRNNPQENVKQLRAGVEKHG